MTGEISTLAPAMNSTNIVPAAFALIDAVIASVGVGSALPPVDSATEPAHASPLELVAGSSPADVNRAQEDANLGVLATVASDLPADAVALSGDSQHGSEVAPGALLWDEGYPIAKTTKVVISDSKVTLFLIY